MIWAWMIFIAFVLGMLALDLGVFHRKSHIVGCKEALSWSGVWITLGFSFAFLVFHAYELHWFGLGLSVDAVGKVVNTGKLAATKYLTAYVVEKSLSVDNIFVIAMVFSSLAVPARYQHRVLFWGILGALLMRGAMIGMSAVLVQNFHWILYFFRNLPHLHRPQNAIRGRKGTTPGRQGGRPLDTEILPGPPGVSRPAFHGQGG